MLSEAQISSSFKIVAKHKCEHLCLRIWVGLFTIFTSSSCSLPPLPLPLPLHFPLLPLLHCHSTLSLCAICLSPSFLQSPIHRRRKHFYPFSFQELKACLPANFFAEAITQPLFNVALCFTLAPDIVARGSDVAGS
jgi:hypothetical protein